MVLAHAPTFHLSWMTLILLAMLALVLAVALGRLLCHCRMASPLLSIGLGSLIVFGYLLSPHRPASKPGRWLPPRAAAAIKRVAPVRTSMVNPRLREPEPSSWVIEGSWEKSYEDAEQNALALAHDKVIAHLRRMEPPLAWQPSTTYVHTYLVKSSAEETKEFGDPVGVMRRVRLEVVITPRDRDILVHHDHRYRVEQRMLALGKVLAGLVAVLAVVAGYIRLDESTKGYYTARLKLAVVVFLVLGLGLLFVIA